MKITCTQENLNLGLTTINKLTTQNINLPILSHILLETREGQLRLAATNLETGINYFIRGKIVKEGSITIPAAVITNYINSLRADKVELEAENEVLQIKTPDDHATLKGLPATDFPFQYSLVNKMKKGKKFVISEENLLHGLTAVSFAAALGELRPEIAGVYMHFEKNVLTLTATDSYRLAEKKIKLNGQNGDTFTVIVPIKAVQELAHVLHESTEEVQIFFTDGQVLFEVRAIDFTAQLIEGQYPDYKQIIPRHLETVVHVDAAELMQAIKRVSIFAARETNDVKMTINPKKQELVFFAETSQAGSSNAKISAEIQGPAQEVTYNHRYFLDGLANIETPRICFETNGQEEPGILKPSQEDHFLYLIMPIRI